MSLRKLRVIAIRIALQAVIPPPLLPVNVLSVWEDPSRAHAQAHAQAPAQARAHLVRPVLALVANRRVRVNRPNSHPSTPSPPHLPLARRLGHTRVRRLLTTPVPLNRMVNAGRSIDIRTSTGRGYA